MSWVGPCAGEDDEEDAVRRANGLRSPPSQTLSESGGSQDFEDDAREAMQEMLGAQEWHQVSLLPLGLPRALNLGYPLFPVWMPSACFARSLFTAHQNSNAWQAPARQAIKSIIGMSSRKRTYLPCARS